MKCTPASPGTAFQIYNMPQQNCLYLNFTVVWAFVSVLSNAILVVNHRVLVLKLRILIGPFSFCPERPILKTEHD